VEKHERRDSKEGPGGGNSPAHYIKVKPQAPSKTKCRSEGKPIENGKCRRGREREREKREKSAGLGCCVGFCSTERKNGKV